MHRWCYSSFVATGDVRMPKSSDLAGAKFGAVPMLIAMCAAPVVAPSLAATQLPIVCVAGSCGPNAPSFLGAGQATATAVGNTLTVQ